MKIIMEFRSAAGGDDSKLFMEELMDAYIKYARKNNIKADVEGEIVCFSGKNAKSLLQEAGVHKTQRISKGKMHTSTVTISTLIAKDKTNIEICDDDLRVEFYRASGNGGQHRNTTDSAVRITHIPTGIVSISADERYQVKNRKIAMERLEKKIVEEREKHLLQNINNDRNSQIRQGERSESDRIYNYIRGEVKDVRTNKSIPLKDFFKGKIEGLWNK